MFILYFIDLFPIEKATIKLQENANSATFTHFHAILSYQGI